MKLLLGRNERTQLCGVLCNMVCTGRLLAIGGEMASTPDETHLRGERVSQTELQLRQIPFPGRICVSRNCTVNTGTNFKP